MKKKLLVFGIVSMFLLTGFIASANKIENSGNKKLFDNNEKDIENIRQNWITHDESDYFSKTISKHFLFSKQTYPEDPNTPINKKSLFMPYVVKFDKQRNMVIGGGIEEVTVTESGAVIFNTLDKHIIMKLDQQGNKIFKIVKEKTQYLYYVLGGIDIDSQNNIIISTLGLKNRLSMRFDCFVSKYNTKGEFLWEKKYELKLPANPYAGCMLTAINSKGDIIFLTESNYFSLIGQTRYYRVIGKIDQNGNLVSKKILKDGTIVGDALWYPFDIKIDSRDNIVFGSMEYIDIDEKEKIYISKYDSNLEAIWDSTVYYDNTKESEVNQNVHIGIDKNNNLDDIIVACTITGRVEGEYCGHVNIIKYDSNGNFLWELTNDGGTYKDVSGVDIDSESNIITNGLSGDVFSDESRAMSTIKYSKNGDLKWEKTYPGIDAYNLALDYLTNDIGAVGGIILATNNGEIALNSTIIKYDSNGNLLWVIDDILVKEGKNREKNINLPKIGFFTRLFNTIFDKILKNQFLSMV